MDLEQSADKIDDDDVIMQATIGLIVWYEIDVIPFFIIVNFPVS